MIVFFNGQFVPEPEARVSVFDRSFQFGDGLFETLRIAGGRPFRWNRHWERLRRGAEGLGIELPYAARTIELALAELIRQNAVKEGLLRITVSRGVGHRGYSPATAKDPVLVMSTHPTQALSGAPARWKLVTSSFRLLEGDPLADWKTNNKLVQVLARAQAEAMDGDEALLLNSAGKACEAASGNLFWMIGDTIHTPPLNTGALPGITRAVILELAATRGEWVVETMVDGAELRNADGAFLTLSSLGMVEIVSLDGLALPSHPATQMLYTAYRDLVRRETLL